jgi:hypothetical protein
MPNEMNSCQLKGRDAMDYWLRCRVYPGQFSVEYAVAIRQADGSDVSLFAPQEVVDCPQPPSFDRPVPGRIRVQLVQQDGKRALLCLPRSTLENGQYITVPTDDLEAIPQRQPA